MSMMLTFRAGKVAALATFLFLAAACSREQQDWRSAEAADTAESYGQFLERHPESELVAIVLNPPSEKPAKEGEC